MAKVRWTRESAIEYLASNPNFSPTKSYDESAKSHYSTSYLKRTASSYEDAERAGRSVPTTAQRRGHERITFHKAEGHVLRGWSVNKKRRDINQADLLEMHKKAKKGNEHSRARKDDDEVIVRITGEIEYIPVKGSLPGNSQITTLTFSTDMESLKSFIDEMTDILNFANEISALNDIETEWQSVHAVEFAFPNEK